MKRFNISDKSIESIIAQLLIGDDNLEDAFARATFSVLTEPGDRFAGALLAAFSAAEVLEFEVQKLSPISIQNRLRAEGQLAEIEESFGDFQISYSEARERWRPRLQLAEVSKALALAVKVKAKLILPESEHWPAQLSDLQLAAPHCLWIRSKSGSVALQQNSISIVGSRISTSYGEWVTSEIVSDCSARELAIVSGGAYGIDAMAHRSAIACGQNTIAVLAGGIDRLYPSGNASLLEKAIDSGALIAEQAPGASPTKWRFLQRNRLIAALGNATIVVEAGFRSGALNTVTHAKQLDRPIGVVPGAITSQASAGCNILIAEGLVSSICSPTQAADLALGKQGWFQPELEGLGALETRALDGMASKALAASQIAAKAGLTTKELTIALGQLTLLGFVEQTDSGWVKLPLEREQSTDTSDQ